MPSSCGRSGRTLAACTETVPLGQLVEALGDAWLHDRAWLKDFRHDEVSISRDLLDVLRAYHRFRHPAE